MGYGIEDKPTGEMVATGMTRHAILDETGRVRRFEPDFIDRLRPLVSQPQAGHGFARRSRTAREPTGGSQ